MEIKLKLDTKKTVKATVAIACAYGLTRVSEASKSPQLAAANALALIITDAILYGPRPAPKKSALSAMRPDAITLLVKEAFDIFPPFEGKPTEDDLFSIREALLPILMVIPFDAVGGIHSLTALLMDEAKYAVAHGGKKFVFPVRLPLYDELIPNDAPTVVRVRAEAAHKSKLEDYNNYEAAECGCAKFLRDVVDEV